MKITGGLYRGIPLHVVSDAVRPTTDRVRESLFSILVDFVPEARVLDLFAGAGTLGLEALSRGAASAQFVEQNPRAASALEQQLKRLKPQPAARVAKEDALRWLKRVGEDSVDLVFADPPYEWKQRPWLDPVCETLLARKALSEDGLLIFERASRDRTEIPPDWELLREKEYGDSCLLFLSPV